MSEALELPLHELTPGTLFPVPRRLSLVETPLVDEIDQGETLESLASQWAEEITPTTQPCVGEGCTHRKEGHETCELTVHHTIYPRRKVLVTERAKLIYSRRSPVSKIMVHKCRHVDIHNSDPPGELNPVFPEDDVIDVYSPDVRVIEDLALAAFHFRNNEDELADEGVEASDQAIDEYLQDRESFHEKRRQLVEKMKGLQIVTPSVITGALLELMPEEGQKRLQVNPVYSLLDFSERTMRSLDTRRKRQELETQGMDYSASSSL